VFFFFKLLWLKLDFDEQGTKVGIWSGVALGWLVSFASEGNGRVPNKSGDTFLKGVTAKRHGGGGSLIFY
jgi:hypothetical protein